MRAAAPSFRSLPKRRRNISGRSKHVTSICSSATLSSNRGPTFLFFKGAANGLFSEGAERLTRGVNDQQAYLIGIRCERGSHRFFKRYGEKFEDSEGKQVFLEFAQEERAHLELLIREYKSLLKRQGRASRRPPPKSTTGSGARRAASR